jgi:hypothetical protein
MGVVEDFQARREQQEQQEQAPPYSISATPFVWKDPATIPPRAWLYGRHLIRKYSPPPSPRAAWARPAC